MSNCKWGHQIKIDSCPSCQSKAVRVSKSNNTVKLDAHWDIVNRLTADLEAATVENKALKDEHHTMQELYEHRHALFLNLISEYSEPAECWKSKKHSDGSSYDGWFIAGIVLPVGPVSYHMPLELWDYCLATEIDSALVWDGYTPNDVVNRLMSLVGKPAEGDET